MAVVHKRLDTEIDTTGSAQYQSVQICIDPTSRNLDKTIQDVVHISAVISERFPAARLLSITVNDYFATVRANLPHKSGADEMTIRLYEINKIWKIRGSAFSDQKRSGNKKRKAYS
ncbi:MAG TPA: hypothetical protein VGK02_06720 [Candidatus Aquicultor sp.]